MRACPQPIIAAIDGVCAGAGAILAMASDIRIGTPTAKVAFLFNRVGLAGCDMGACAILPRIIGQGRAAELLYTGRVLGGEEAERWGFFNRLARARRGAGAGAAAGRRARRRADLRQRHDQAHAGDGMGDVGRRPRSRPRRWRRRCAWRRKISRAPSAPSPPSRSRCSRATEMAPRRNPELALLRRRPSRLRRGARALGRRDAARRCRTTMSMRPAARA